MSSSSFPPGPSGVSGVDWPTAFVATSAVLGEPLEVTLATLGPSATPRSSELTRHLEGASREVRAQALAAVLTEVVAEVGAGAWG